MGFKMINIQPKGKRDYIVSNSKKVDRYGWSGDENNKCHTHIAGYNCNHRTAVQLKYNVIHERIPTLNKFVLCYVGKRNYIRYLESHLRVSDNTEYCDKLKATINGKNKQKYYNKKMKVAGW